MNAISERRTEPDAHSRLGGSPPRRLQELRIGLVGSDALRAALASACRVEMYLPGGWRGPFDWRSPHLLLVEGGERLDPEWHLEIDELLEACEQHGVPSILWITAARCDPAYIELAGSFHRSFAVGIGQLMALLEAGVRDPSLLWAATSLPLDDRPVLETAARPDPVVWIGDWRDDWPEAWRTRLEDVLRAAASRGLSIVGASDPAALPEWLRQHVRSTPQGRAEALERARLAIAADPTVAVDDVVPAIVFDAVACGAAVVSPAAVGSVWEFCAGGTAATPPRALIPAVGDLDSATAEIDRLLDDDELRELVVHRCRRVVAYNHTYAHRAATLATAAGLRLIPDAPWSPAHS